MTNNFSVSRRGFLATSAALVVTVAAPKIAVAQNVDPNALGAFIRIEPEGEVTFVSPTFEMGQGSLSGLALIVADELGADWNKIKVVNAPVAPAYNVPGTPVQYAAGSQAVRRWHAPLRLAAAQARTMLTEAAASQWDVPVAECRTQDGFVIHKASGNRVPFADIVSDAAQLPVPEAPALRDDNPLTGSNVTRIDLPSKTNGTAIYGIDVRVPEMVYAAIRQAPVFRAALVSVDASALDGMPGIIEVVELEDAVAVVADSFWKAKQAVEALDVEFAKSTYDYLATEDIAQSQKLQLDTRFAVASVNEGSAFSMIRDASNVYSSDYDVPYLHHMTMEPMCCTAHITDDTCEFWVPTQYSSAVRGVGMRVSGLPAEQVIVNTTHMGGGLGRKFEMDYVDQSAKIAKQVGRPVQLIWTREEDVQHGRYRPMMTARLTASIAEDGTPEAMRIRLVGPSIPEFRNGIPFKNGFDFRAGLGITTETESAPGKLQQYKLDNLLAEIIYQPAHVPVGSWRSVGASENGFFIESFIDELAHEAGRDPVEFRRTMLRDSPRGLAVFDRVVEEFDWDAELPEGHFKGIAFSEAVGSIVVQAVEVSMENDEPKVHRVVCAIDCGKAIHPDSVEAQTVGCIIMGISSALYEKITITDGHCAESNFYDYRVLTLEETPDIQVHIMESDYNIGGVGEAAIPGTAPALANAIFAATGKRIRSLPIIDHI